MSRATRTLPFFLGIATVLLQLSTGAAPTYTPWSEPSWLGDVLNSPWDDALASPSKDGLSLYFTSNRPAAAGGVGGYDIWVSQRPTTEAEWGRPVCLDLPVNTPLNEAGPWLSRDGHLLFFHRATAAGDYDLMVSWRRHTDDDFGWEEPINLGPNVNSTYNDAGASLFEGEGSSPAELYFGSQRRGTWDIFRSVMGEDGTFGPAEYVAELSSAGNEQRPAISYDGKEIYLSTSRTGGVGLSDIWRSTRPALAAAWAPPVNVAELNTTFIDAQAAPSSKGDEIFFNSTRSPTLGMTDLWVARRVKARH